MRGATWGDCPDCGGELAYDDIGDIDDPVCGVCNTPLLGEHGDIVDTVELIGGES